MLALWQLQHYQGDTLINEALDECGFDTPTIQDDLDRLMAPLKSNHGLYPAAAVAGALARLPTRDWSSPLEMSQDFILLIFTAFSLLTVLGVVSGWRAIVESEGGGPRREGALVLLYVEVS